MNKRFSTNQNRRVSKGSPESKLSLFDRSSNDLELFNLIDDELIKLSGSKIYYYKSYFDESYDKVYLEKRNRIVSKTPILLWASFDPRAIEEEMSEFGLELTNDQTFVFNKSYIETHLGRPPQEGDIIKTTFQSIKYEIHEVQEDSFEGYGSYHYNCFAKVLRDSEDVVDEPNIEIFDKVGAKVYLKTDNTFAEIPPVYEYNMPISNREDEGGGGGGGGSTPATTTIRWSPEGIIYVNAPDDINGYYALGYVHAREYGDSLFAMLTTSTGKVSEYFHSNNNYSLYSFLNSNLAAGSLNWGVDSDTGYFGGNGGYYSGNNQRRNMFWVFDAWQHVLDVPNTANDLYNELDQVTKDKVDAFTSGINNAMETLWSSQEFSICRSFFPAGPPIVFTPQHIVARDVLRWLGAWSGIFVTQLQQAISKYPQCDPPESLQQYPYAGMFINENTKDFLNQIKDLVIPDVTPVGGPLNSSAIYGDLDTFQFSNEWTFNGGVTETGKAMLQIDPHLRQKDASYRFITVSYRSNQTRVAGAMIGGIPNVLLGYNQNVSWGLTAGSIASTKFYMFFVVRDSNNPDQMKYYVPVGDVDASQLELRSINQVDQTVSRFYPPLPTYIAETTDKYQIGRVLGTWYTSSLGQVTPPPGVPSLPGNGLVYEIGMAVRFPKDFRQNGVRLFHDLNVATNATDVKTALARLDTPFYNFVYATKDNVIGYYNLGTVPNYSVNEGYGRGFNSVPRRIDTVVLADIKFSHTTPLIYWSSLHPVDDLPNVENPDSNWLVCNNATPNYVTQWVGDPKEIRMQDFPLYMHDIDAIFPKGTERQAQAFVTFNAYTLNGGKITVEDAKNIISGKGGTIDSPYLNETSWHYAYMMINFYKSFRAFRNLIPANVTLPTQQTVAIDLNKIEPEIYLWYDLALSFNIKASENDRIYPRFYWFLNAVYYTFGASMRGLDPYTFGTQNHLYWGQSNQGKDIMLWDPNTELLTPDTVNFFCGIMTEAINGYESTFDFNTRYADIFKANSSVADRDLTNGNLYPMKYGGRHLKLVTYTGNNDQNNRLYFEAVAGQVFGLLVDFSTETTRSFLSKPIHGTTDPNKAYFNVLTEKWANGDMTEIRDFGFIPDGQYIEQVSIVRM